MDSISSTYNRSITDVVKSVCLVEKFYEKSQLNQQYNKELEYNLVKHILIQIEKIPKLSVKDRVYVYLYFKKVLKSIDYDMNSYISDTEKKKIADYMHFVF